MPSPMNRKTYLGDLTDAAASGSQSGGMRFLRLLRDLGGVGGAAGQRGGGQGTDPEVRLRFFSCLFVPPNFSWTVCDRWVKAILAALR